MIFREKINLATGLQDEVGKPRAEWPTERGLCHNVSIAHEDLD